MITLKYFLSQKRDLVSDISGIVLIYRSCLVFMLDISPSSSPSSPTTTTTTETPKQCLDDSDCQDNAGCFATEEIDPLTFECVTTCHCYMGYLLDNGTASFPKTGFCEDLRTRECTGTDSDYCYENDEEWGICPYCRVSTLMIVSI